jgi:hypothetical protein
MVDQVAVALIGVPMGRRVGIWGLDVDSKAEEVDGRETWSNLEIEHGVVDTRSHLTGTEGYHLLFLWDQPIGNSNGLIPRKQLGEVKGEGGYLIFPAITLSAQRSNTQLSRFSGYQSRVDTTLVS